jgi:hypothetical protein
MCSMPNNTPKYTCYVKYNGRMHLSVTYYGQSCSVVHSVQFELHLPCRIKEYVKHVPSQRALNICDPWNYQCALNVYEMI